MVRRRLDELAELYGLGPASVTRYERLLARLAEDENAPTTVRDPCSAVDVHVADSLSALDLPEVAQARVIADLGSRAGFPALVLAIALPAARVHAIESVGRKCDYLTDVVADLELDNVEVVRHRAEEWLAGWEACDVVCARALAALGVLCEYAAPLLRLDGLLVAWKGELSSEELAAARVAARRLGMSDPEVIPVRPFAAAHSRHLSAVRKIAPTPPGFPRRAGNGGETPAQIAARAGVFHVKRRIWFAGPSPSKCAPPGDRLRAVAASPVSSETAPPLQLVASEDGWARSTR